MRSCRICYGNDDPFISPCKCKGSMKWVHPECLNMWRAQNQSTFYECPTCKYKYQIQRVVWAKYIQNPITLAAVTVLCILLIIGLFAYFLNFLLFLFGSGAVQNVWMISRQIAWYAALIVGIAAFMLLTDKENQIGMAFDVMAYPGVAYGASAFGLFSLFGVLYQLLKVQVMLVLSSLGDRILQVDPEEQ